MFKVLQSGSTKKNYYSKNELVSGINYSNYVVKKTNDCWVAIPNDLKHLDLAILLKSKNPSIITGTDTAEIKRIIDLQEETPGIEYLGWSPAFEAFGNCGTHPQFYHRDHPPDGWHFRTTVPPRQKSKHYLLTNTLDGMIKEVLASGPTPTTNSETGKEQFVGNFLEFPSLQVYRKENGDYLYRVEIFKSLTEIEKTGPSKFRNFVLVEQNHNNTYYNIVSCFGLYFGFHAGNGNFSAYGVITGKYNHPTFISDTLEEVRDMISRDGIDGLDRPVKVGSSSTFSGLNIYYVNPNYIAVHVDEFYLSQLKNLEISIKRPKLVHTNFEETNYNIIYYSGLYFGFHAGNGNFSAYGVITGKYNHPTFISDTLEEVRDMISRDGIDGLDRPVKVGSSSTFSGLNIYYVNPNYIAVHVDGGEKLNIGEIDKLISTGVGIEAATLKTLLELVKERGWLTPLDTLGGFVPSGSDLDHLVSFGAAIEAKSLNGLFQSCSKLCWIKEENPKDFRPNADTLTLNAGKPYKSLDILVSEVGQQLQIKNLFNISERPILVFENVMGTKRQIFFLHGIYGSPKSLNQSILRSFFLPYVVKAKTKVGLYIKNLKIGVRLFFPVFGLFMRSIWRGGKITAFIEFLKSRNLAAQKILITKAEVLFLPSVPYVVNQYPWIIELEDITSFFFPFIHNGKTRDVIPSQNPQFPMLKAMIESSSCRAIVTHIKTTAEGLPKVFEKPEIAKKIFYIPMGLEIPKRLPRKTSDEEIKILFTGSWHQNETNFFLRGGLDTLFAFEKIAQGNSNVNLVLRTPIPKGEVWKGLTHLMRKYPNQVTIYQDFMEKNEWQQLLCDTDIFVLPSARIHVVSILEAMSFGVPVVVSDGWGFSDYIDHGKTGIIIPGRYGVVSWYDENTGMLREDYEPMFSLNESFGERLIKELEHLISYPEERKMIGDAGRKEVRDRFNIANWNKGLKSVLDQTM